MLFNIFGFNL